VVARPAEAIGKDRHRTTELPKTAVSGLVAKTPLIAPRETAWQVASPAFTRSAVTNRSGRRHGETERFRRNDVCHGAAPGKHHWALVSRFKHS
jgi:hypothetical protein